MATIAKKYCFHSHTYLGAKSHSKYGRRAYQSIPLMEWQPILLEAYGACTCLAFHFPICMFNEPRRNTCTILDHTLRVDLFFSHNFCVLSPNDSRFIGKVLMTITHLT